MTPTNGFTGTLDLTLQGTKPTLTGIPLQAAGTVGLTLTDSAGQPFPRIGLQPSSVSVTGVQSTGQTLAVTTLTSTRVGGVRRWSSLRPPAEESSLTSGSAGTLVVMSRTRPLR